MGSRDIEGREGGDGTPMILEDRRLRLPPMARRMSSEKSVQGDKTANSRLGRSEEHRERR